MYEGIPRGRELAAQGFALNFLNPTVWLYWISVITFITGEINIAPADRYGFFISLLAAELGVGILKCRLASLLQNIFSANMMNIVNKVVGVILVGIGIYLIVSMIAHQTNPQLPEKDPNDGATQFIQRIHSNMAKESDTFYLK